MSVEEHQIMSLMEMELELPDTDGEYAREASCQMDGTLLDHQGIQGFLLVGYLSKENKGEMGKRFWLKPNPFKIPK